MSTCCDIEELDDDVIDDQSNSCSDDSDLDFNTWKNGKVVNIRKNTRYTIIGSYNYV